MNDLVSYDFLITLCHGLNFLDGSNIFSFEECEDGSLKIYSVQEKQLLLLYNLLYYKCAKFNFSLRFEAQVLCILCSPIAKFE